MMTGPAMAAPAPVEGETRLYRVAGEGDWFYVVVREAGRWAGGLAGSAAWLGLSAEDVDGAALSSKGMFRP
jgi:hypothetical protein